MTTHEAIRELAKLLKSYGRTKPAVYMIGRDEISDEIFTRTLVARPALEALLAENEAQAARIAELEQALAGKGE